MKPILQKRARINLKKRAYKEKQRGIRTIEKAARVHGILLGEHVPERLEVHGGVEIEGLGRPLAGGLGQSFFVGVKILVVRHPDSHQRYPQALELGGLLPRLAGVAPLRQHRRLVQQAYVDDRRQQSARLAVHLRSSEFMRMGRLLPFFFFSLQIEW